MIIGFVNQKGGVGKTTLSINFAFRLMEESGDRVLLVDADPQGSIMEWSDKRQMALPGSCGLVAMPKKTLHRDLPNIIDDYDWVVIDSSPRSTDIARSVILASDVLVIPCTPSPFDVWSSMETVRLIQEASVYKETQIAVFVINRKIVNTAIGRDVREAIESLGGGIKIMETEISQRVIFAEGANGLTVSEMERKGKAHQEITQFMEELFKIIEESSKEETNEEKS